MKDLSVFHTRLGFKMVTGFVLESMHLLGGGVFGNVIDMLTSFDRDGFIHTKDFDLLCDRMDVIAKDFWISDPARALRYFVNICFVSYMFHIYVVYFSIRSI